jgi:manganese/zinc/iron transport system permease protein
MGNLWLWSDPLLRGPLIACAVLGALSGAFGVLLVFRRQSLVGETLSHACYPGLIIGALLAEVFLPFSDETILAFVGAVLSCLIAARAITYLEKSGHIPGDAALSCVLATSFSVGLCIISSVQTVYPSLWRRLQMLLVGQAITMRDQQAALAVVCALLGGAFILRFSRSLKVLLFDKDFAYLTCLTNRAIEGLFFGVLVLTVIVSVRLMGVVLMSALFIFPAISARLLSSNFQRILGLAALIGGACGCGGLLISNASAFALTSGEGHSLWLPTGPLIVLLLVACFSGVLLFSPKEGLCIRALRRAAFMRRCQAENMLKVMWKECSECRVWSMPVDRLAEISSLSRSSARSIIRRLVRKGFLEGPKKRVVEMTPQGIMMGRKLVRLHRLWELYLVEHCGVPKERVHPNAEEMEHILTPAIEKELRLLLGNPSHDPHQQPIPQS